MKKHSIWSQENYVKISLIDFDSYTTINLIDNNKADYATINNSDFNLTVESVNRESNSTLSNKCLIISDFWDFTSFLSPVPVQVDIFINGSLNNSFIINSSYGFETLTSSNGFSVNLKEGVLEGNKAGEIADFNLSTIFLLLPLFLMWQVYLIQTNQMIKP